MAGRFFLPMISDNGNPGAAVVLYCVQSQTRIVSVVVSVVVNSDVDFPKCFPTHYLYYNRLRFFPLAIGPGCGRFSLAPEASSAFSLVVSVGGVGLRGCRRGSGSLSSYIVFCSLLSKKK